VGKYLEGKTIAVTGSGRGIGRAIALACAAVDDATAWCLLAIIVGVMLGGLIVTAGIMTAKAPGGRLDEQSPEAVAIGCGKFEGVCCTAKMNPC
jgi:hypothetical protein